MPGGLPEPFVVKDVRPWDVEEADCLWNQATGKYDRVARDTIRVAHLGFTIIEFDDGTAFEYADEEFVNVARP